MDQRFLGAASCFVMRTLDLQLSAHLYPERYRHRTICTGKSDATVSRTNTSTQRTDEPAGLLSHFVKLHDAAKIRAPMSTSDFYPARRCRAGCVNSAVMISFAGKLLNY